MKGEKVVCVDDSLPPWGWKYVPPVVKGNVYTIRGTYSQNGIGGVWLDEAAAYVVWAGIGEPGYLASRFAPIKKTSIEIFRAIDRKIFNTVNA